MVKVTERSALVQVAASTQQLTSHAGLVLVRELAGRLGVSELLKPGDGEDWAYLLCTLLAFNLLAWLKLLALPERERSSYAKRLRFRFIAVAATVGRSGRRLVLRLSAGYPHLNDFIETLQRIRGLVRAPA